MKIHDVEQGSEEWHLKRSFIPTASSFKKIITSKGEPSKTIEAYSQELAGAMYAGKSLDKWQGNSSTERGTELEPEARRAYEFITGNEVKQVGFITNKEETYGASPDGLIGENGGIEIKCREAKGHIETLLYFKKNGKCQPDYIAQSQGEILVCELEWVDMFFYHPDLPSLIIRQEKNIQIQMALIKGIKEVNTRKEEILKTIQSF